MKPSETVQERVGHTHSNDHTEILYKGVTNNNKTEDIPHKDLLIKLGKGNKPRSCGKPAAFMSNTRKFYQRIVYCGKHNCPSAQCHSQWVKDHAPIIEKKCAQFEDKFPDWHDFGFMIKLNQPLTTKQEATELYKRTEEFVRLKLGEYAFVVRILTQFPSFPSEDEADAQYMIVFGRSFIPFFGEHEPLPMDFVPLPRYSINAMLQHSLKAFRMKAYRMTGIGHVAEKRTTKKDPLLRYESRIKRRAEELRKNGVKISKADLIHVRDRGLINPELGDYGVRLYGKLWRSDLTSWCYLHFGEWGD